MIKDIDVLELARLSDTLKNPPNYQTYSSTTMHDCKEECVIAYINDSYK